MYTVNMQYAQYCDIIGTKGHGNLSRSWKLEMKPRDM